MQLRSIKAARTRKLREGQRPAWMHPISWLYVQAERSIPRQGTYDETAIIRRRRHISVAFDKLLRATGVHYGTVEPQQPVPKRRPTVAIVRHGQVELVVLSGHVPTRIVPPGWTVEGDIREELLALSELSAMHRIGVQIHD